MNTNFTFVQLLQAASPMNIRVNPHDPFDVAAAIVAVCLTTYIVFTLYRVAKS